MPAASRQGFADHDLLNAVGELAHALDRADGLDEIEREYIDAAARLLPFRAVGLYLFAPHSTSPVRIAARGVSDFFLARYEERGREQDPVLARAFERRGAVLNREMMDEREWRDLPVWGEVFRLHEMTTLLEVPVVSDGEVVGTLNFGDRDDPPCGVQSALTLADAAARLVGLALSARTARQRCERQRHTLATALDVCDQAIIVSDLESGERHLNTAARDLCEHIMPGDSECWLEDLMAEATPRDGELRLAEDWVVVDGEPTRVLLRVLVDRDDPSVQVAFLGLDEVTEQSALPPHIAAGLTPREREVVQLVVAGLHDHEIAQRLLLSPHTVKDYLKQVYRKLGLDSRIGLARLVLTSGATGARPAATLPAARASATGLPVLDAS